MESEVAARLRSLIQGRGNDTWSTRSEWDYHLDHVLIWYDGKSHHCVPPSRRIRSDHTLKTICGLDVTSSRLALVEVGPDSDPTCSKCLALVFSRSLEGGRNPSTRKNVSATIVTLVFLIAALAYGVMIYPHDRFVLPWQTPATIVDRPDSPGDPDDDPIIDHS